LRKLNFKKNGYFIELGGDDGVRKSNTYFFERYFDWDGILIESKKAGRPIKYYVFPSKEGVPIITLHDDEEDILKDRKLHKRVIGEIINKITEEL